MKDEPKGFKPKMGKLEPKKNKGTCYFSLGFCSG
jgi:hypothetical protein